jgi:hypothetical protein
MPKDVCDESWIVTAQRALGLDVSEANDVSEHVSDPEENQSIDWGLFSDEKDNRSWPKPPPSFYESSLQQATPGPDLPTLKPYTPRQCLFGDG